MRSPCADRHRPDPGSPRLSPAQCAIHSAALRTPCTTSGSAMRRNAPDSLRIRLSFGWRGRCGAGIRDQRVLLHIAPFADHRVPFLGREEQSVAEYPLDQHRQRRPNSA